MKTLIPLIMLVSFFGTASAATLSNAQKADVLYSKCKQQHDDIFCKNVVAKFKQNHK
jgi:hypothetical protein